VKERLGNEAAEKNIKHDRRLQWKNRGKVATQNMNSDYRRVWETNGGKTLWKTTSKWQKLWCEKVKSIERTEENKPHKTTPKITEDYDGRKEANKRQRKTSKIEAKVWGQSTVLPWTPRLVPDFHLCPYRSHPMANETAHVELMATRISRSKEPHLEE